MLALVAWAYRFEAYTPAPQRVRGYYALPLLWRDRVIAGGNLAVRDARLQAELGYTTGRATPASAPHCRTKRLHGSASGLDGS